MRSRFPTPSLVCTCNTISDMKMTNPVVTKDGSHTLKMPGRDEHYHSTFGAISESRHVFINAGLNKLLDTGIEQLHILEIGMGTGLNALLTICEVSGKGINVEYTSLEPFPIEESVWNKLNYPAMMQDHDALDWFRRIHESPWESNVSLAPDFGFIKYEIKLQDFRKAKDLYNLVYFDAFSPDIQPELWTQEIFDKLFGMLNKEGILVTYSAKGSVRRALKSAGFEVERIPGPKGKREMMRAVKR